MRKLININIENIRNDKITTSWGREEGIICMWASISFLGFFANDTVFAFGNGGNFAGIIFGTENFISKIISIF